MAKHKIRTTMRPNDEIEVEGPEMLDLHRQGLILPPLPAPPPVEDQTPPAPVEDDSLPPASQRGRKPNNGGK